jgi:peptide/nickel transport system substrate-binding protein
LLEDASPEEFIDSDFNRNPIGSGAYQFDQFLVEDSALVGVILKGNPVYFEGAPFIDQLVFRYYPDSTAAMAAFQEGEVMGISTVTPDILSEALAEPDLNLYTGRLPQLSLVLFNLDNPEVPFLQDQVVRHALLLSINRQRIIDQILSGQGIIANGPIFPGTWAYFDGQEVIEFSPEAAISLLRSSEYTIPAEGGSVRTKDDVALSFTLLHPTGEPYAQVAALIQQSWAEIGVQVELEPVDYDILVEEHLAGRDFHAALVDLNLSRFPDPDPYPFWHQAQISSGQNYSRWDDRPASEYLEQARVTLDLEERGRLYRNFQVRFGRELPALPLYYPVYTYAVDAQIQGVRMGPLFDPSDRLDTAATWFILSGDSNGANTGTDLP